MKMEKRADTVMTFMAISQKKGEQGGRVTKYMYDRKSRLKGVILPDKTEIICIYDPCDNLISYRDEAGNLPKKSKNWASQKSRK